MYFYARPHQERARTQKSFDILLFPLFRLPTKNLPKMQEVFMRNAFRPERLLATYDSRSAAHSTLVTLITLVGRCKCTGVLPVFTTMWPDLRNPRSFKMLIWSKKILSRPCSSL